MRAENVRSSAWRDYPITRLVRTPFSGGAMVLWSRLGFLAPDSGVTGGISSQGPRVAGRSGGDRKTRHRIAKAAACSKTEAAASAGTDQS